MKVCRRALPVRESSSIVSPESHRGDDKPQNAVTPASALSSRSTLRYTGMMISTPPISVVLVNSAIAPTLAFVMCALPLGSVSSFASSIQDAAIPFSGRR